MYVSSPPGMVPGRSPDSAAFRLSALLFFERCESVGAKTYPGDIPAADEHHKEPVPYNIGPVVGDVLLLAVGV